MKLGQWDVSLHIWNECPPCPGSLFGCWHWRDDEDTLVETIVPLFGDTSLFFMVSK